MNTNQFSNIEKDTAGAEALDAMNVVEAAFGGIPNLMKKLAASPGVLSGVMALNNGISNGSIEQGIIEQVALLTSRRNNCEYCVAVHVHVGQQCGIPRDELISNMNGQASDPSIQVVLDFVNSAIDNRGQISPELVNRMRNSGYDNQQILEILAVVGLYTFLNYAKHLTQPDLDFPEVAEFSNKDLITS